MKTIKSTLLLLKIVIIIITIFLLINFNHKQNAISQTKMKKENLKETNILINGYAKSVTGEVIDYHSCHPDAKSALLIRCLNEKDYIEWETDTIPINYKGDLVTFIWITGYSTGTSTRSHKFYLYINDKERFIFKTYPELSESDWIINDSTGAELKFKYIKKDIVNDFFGYMFLKVPTSEIKNLKTLRLKVKGDASNSRDWYMTFKYSLKQKTRISPEYLIVKGENGKLFQQVKVVIDHYDQPEPVLIFTPGNEIISSNLNFGMNEFFIHYDLENIPVNKHLKVTIGKQTTDYEVILNPVRKFTIYLLPHSHVDIGYTALQTEVEKLQWKYIDDAIELSRKTNIYPEDARFKWNVEVLWAVDGYLKNAAPEKRKIFFEAVKNGWIGLDGLYGNELTGLCRPEELFRLVDFSNQLEKQCSVKIESAMISDVPGYSWGMVPALADNGIKYFSIGPNQFDRIGYTLDVWGDKPFYWKSPDGNKQILCWMSSKGYSWFHGWRLTGGDTTPLLNYLFKLDSTNYPYDIIQLRYTIGGDNGYPDTALSDFVKNWNEKYESPKFKIATTSEMFHDFESRYKDKIPSFSGDFTPYWEDGAASSACETALNRSSAENLVQSEILWSILNPKNFPRQEFDEAWKNVLLYSEHTWGAWNSISEPESKFVLDQWRIKQSFALKADSISKSVFTGVINNLFTQQNEIRFFNVFNTSSWKRTDLVTIPKEWNIISNIITDEKDNIIPTQRLSTGELVFIAKDVPALGSKRYKLKKGGKEFPGKVNIEKNTLSNKYYKVTFNEETGSIKTLVKKGENKNFVDIGKDIGLNEYFYTGRNAENPRKNFTPTITFKEKGPVLTSFLIESDAPGCKKLKREVRLFSELARIDLINTIDKARVLEKENVRFAFPFNIMDGEIKMDLAWTVVRPEVDQIEGSNKNYYTIQRWVDVSNNNEGITLATVDAPLLEIGEMTGEAWMSTPDRSWMKHALSSPLFYSWVMNNSWHTNYKAEQDGLSVFRYSIKPHEKFDFLHAYRFGIEQSQPLLAIPIDKNKSAIPSPFTLDTKTSVVITSIKPGQDSKSLMVRLYNPTNSTTQTSFHWRKDKHPTCYQSSPEEITGDILHAVLTFKPFEIKTVKIVESY